MDKDKVRTIVKEMRQKKNVTIAEVAKAVGKNPTFVAERDDDTRPRLVERFGSTSRLFGLASLDVDDAGFDKHGDPFDQVAKPIDHGKVVREVGIKLFAIVIECIVTKLRGSRTTKVRDRR